MDDSLRQRISRRIVLFLTPLFVLIATPSILAGPPAGTFPAEIEQDGRTLALNGYGLCEWGLFNWNLYWGALYLEEKSSSASEIIESEQAKRVHLYFVRTLTREQMVKAYTAAFQVNAGDDLPKYQQGLDELTRMLTEVESGDSLVFTYLPGRGLIVAFNGKARGTIEGVEFSRMFFRLYLGPKPPDKNLKKGMLGQGKDP